MVKIVLWFLSHEKLALGLAVWLMDVVLTMKLHKPAFDCRALDYFAVKYATSE